MYNLTTVLLQHNASIEKLRELLVDLKASPEMLQSVSHETIETALSGLDITGIEFDVNGSAPVRVNIVDGDDGKKMAVAESIPNQIEAKSAVFEAVKPLIFNKDDWKDAVILVCPKDYAQLLGEALRYCHGSQIELLDYKGDENMMFVCSAGYCAD